MVPAGSTIRVKTIGLASTKTNRRGDMILASVEAPGVAGGRTAIPRGAPANLRVESIEDGVELSLASVTVGGHPYLLTSYAQQIRKGVLSRAAGAVHKKRNDGEAPETVPPQSHLQFTLRQAVEVAP